MYATAEEQAVCSWQSIKEKRPSFMIRVPGSQMSTDNKQELLKLCA